MSLCILLKSGDFGFLCFLHTKQFSFIDKHDSGELHCSYCFKSSYPGNYSSESIHIFNIVTLEEQLSFQGSVPALGWG